MEASSKKMLERLNEVNDVEVKSVFNDSFKSFGRVIEGFDLSSMISYMSETPLPDRGNIYLASDPLLEKIDTVKEIKSVIYGGMPIEVGYCNGKNRNINGFEYHKGSELNIAIDPFMLCLGHTWDIRSGNKFYEDDIHLFFVPAGTMIEMFETTLHLSPICAQSDGFRDIVILPRGTNTALSMEEKEMAGRALDHGFKEAGLLLQKNKWVIACPDRKPLIDQDAFPGFVGENKEFKF